MIRHRYTLIIISMAMISGWVFLSGSSAYQATETSTPTETVTPSFTPTMPWCESNEVKATSDLIPRITIQSLNIEQPIVETTPEPGTQTATITATIETVNMYELIADSTSLLIENELMYLVNFGGVNLPEGYEWNCSGYNNYLCGDFYLHEFDTNGDDDAYGGHVRCWDDFGYFEIGDEPGTSVINKHTRACKILGYKTGSGDRVSLNRGRIWRPSIATITPVPTQISTLNCREYTDIYKDADPFVEFDYNYIGNTCISLFSGIELSLDDLPNVLLDAMDFLDTTGIFDISAVPELEVSGLEVCLDQYQPIITIMDMDLVTPLSVMITLVVIGGLINEFRS